MTKPPQSRKLVRQKVGPVDKRRRPRGLTKAIRAAIDAIVHDRCTRAQACKSAGITERALYLALQKAEVAAHWNSQIEVLRSAERPFNVLALAAIRDGKMGEGTHSNPMAVVQAVAKLEQLSENDAVLGRPGAHEQAGLTIRVIHQAPALPGETGRMIDVTPNPRRSGE